jgi:hypothetical protein
MIRMLFLLAFLYPPALRAQESLLKDKDAVAPATVRSEEVTFWNAADSVRLAGTLTLPPTGTRFAGSGPDFRLGTHRPRRDAGYLQVFKQLAEYLTGRGFAVLRYDDRGVGQSTGVPFPRTTSADLRPGCAGRGSVLAKSARHRPAQSRAGRPQRRAA